ncbi:hypothetical protein ACGFY9_28005 [Streptomyces sp. NPDC048504]|uniref:hypothetical protein n=1 Tax=Streptomyces sp. NPDC048504 TaxID=3365559 RepID=UPI0037242F9B
MALFREHGEAGLVPGRAHACGSAASADTRWVETALEVMARVHRSVAAVADAGDRADAGAGDRTVRSRGGGAAESGNGVSDPSGAGASASSVPAEYEAEPGHRRPPGGAVREAAAHTSG